jgi:hypothetical protein
MARYIIIGSIGSDAGYWVLDDTGLHHVGGWGTEAFLEVRAGLEVLKASAQLKTPALAEAVAELVTKAIEPELAEHIGGEHTVIIT